MLPAPAFNQVYQLQESLVDVECLNSHGTATLEKGSYIRLENLYDQTHCTVLASTRRSADDPRIHRGGLPLSDGMMGYLFIVEIAALQNAISSKLGLAEVADPIAA